MGLKTSAFVITFCLTLCACASPVASPVSSTGTSGPAGIMGDDPFITKARLALASYQEVEASLSDSRMLASQRFSSLPLPLAAVSKADPNDFDVPVLGQISSQSGLNGVSSALPSFDASVAVFEDTVSRFHSQLLAAQGVEFDGTGKILIKPHQLRARIRSDLLGEGNLADPSLDLNGRLKANVHANLALSELSGLGVSATSSDVAAVSADSESLLLTFRDLDADLTNRVRVTSRTRVRPGYELRLDTKSAGFARTGLRDISYEPLGIQMRTEVDTQLDDGSKLELSEQRFVSPNGAGSGFGSFAISAGGRSYNGILRSLVSADGHLTLLLESDDSSLGRLMLQESTAGKATLTLYRSDGQVSSTSEIDLEATLDALAQG